MPNDFATLSRQLADRAEAVCRQYLSSGRREGRYWTVGNAYNTPGRSMFVRLAARDGDRLSVGKWTDAATGEHGDLLDIIALSLGYRRTRDTLEEARRFLGSAPAVADADPLHSASRSSRPSGTPDAARRLFAASRPIAGTVAERYLRAREIHRACNLPALRFHPNCFYRRAKDDAPDTRAAWPALIAAVTDEGGTIVGVHRTWIDPLALTKAPIATPRRAMGHLLGAGVRFGSAGAVMVAGEGIETMLSLRSALPDMPMIAALSSAHLAALAFPPLLRRLYVARDNDRAGAIAVARLAQRAIAAGVEVIPLVPALLDFNDDHRLLDSGTMKGGIARQLRDDDRGRYLDDPFGLCL
ncbi:toprim domain-containing protein [soil metagenome]